MIKKGLLKTKRNQPSVIKALVSGQKVEVDSLCIMLQNTDYHISLAKSA